MIIIPVALLAGGLLWLFWRADMQMPAVTAALVLGYSLATSPVAGAVNEVGTGISSAVQDASNDTSNDTSGR